MSKKTSILAVAAIINILVGCVSYSPIRGNGNLAALEKTVSGFEKINISGSAEVHFHTSPEFRIVVTVDENLAEYVEIVTKDNVLNVGTKNGSYSFTKFLVDVYSPVLTGVSVSGSGSFSSVDKITVPTFAMSVTGSGNIEGTVECENFSARVTGSGDIIVTGNSKNADIVVTGSGEFKGNDFIIGDATVHINGSGNIVMYVTDNLKANISGSGEINYRGEPKIDIKNNGSGRIRKM